MGEFLRWIYLAFRMHVTKMSRERAWNWLCSIILLSRLSFLPQSFSFLSLLNVLNLRLSHLKLSLTFSKYILHFKWHETFVLLWFWARKMYFLIHITRVSHACMPAIIYYGIQQNWNSLSEHNLGLEFERTWPVLSTFKDNNQSTDGFLEINDISGCVVIVWINI